MEKSKYRAHEYTSFPGETEKISNQAMPSTMEPKYEYEEQFTAFVDFLGFSEASAKTDEVTRLKVLDLLVALSTLRGEFGVESTVQEGRKTSHIKPAISTFSDH